MEIQLTPDQKALGEERERICTQMLAAVDVAEASLSRGEGREITRESMGELAEEMHWRGRARLGGGTILGFGGLVAHRP